MATLNQVTKTSRHILAIGLIIVIGIFLVVTIGNFIKSLFPTPLPPPTVAFGKLPQIIFPQINTSVQLTYSLDTLSGNLPDFGDRATIYAIQTPSPTLNALDNTKLLVQRMGYNGDPLKISDTYYQWTNTDTLPKTLLMNIFSNDFAITSSYTNNQDVINGNNFPDQNGAIDTVMNFLQSTTLLPDDIDTSKTKATLLSLTNGKLTSATSLSSAQIIQVDLFQNDVNKLPIFYPQPTHSTMTLYVGGGDSTPQIVLANFNHQSITTNHATYPILSSAEAFDQLKKGNGYIASFDGTGTSISIRSVVLGYYMSDKTQSYLMPIIVFEGDHGFFGYVPAVKGEWIHN